LSCISSVVTMVELIKKEAIPLPPQLDGLTEENFIRYLAWRDDRSQLRSMVSTPFVNAIYEDLGLDGSVSLDRVTEFPLEVGSGFQFQVVAKPTTKRPEYKPALLEFQRYVIELKT